MSLLFPYIVYVTNTNNVSYIAETSSSELQFDAPTLRGYAVFDELVSPSRVLEVGVAGNAIMNNLLDYFNATIADQVQSIGLTASSFPSGSFPTTTLAAVHSNLVTTMLAVTNNNPVLPGSVLPSEAEALQIVLRPQSVTTLTPTLPPGTSRVYTDPSTGLLQLRSAVGNTVTLTSPIKTLLAEILPYTRVPILDPELSVSNVPAPTSTTVRYAIHYTGDASIVNMLGFTASGVDFTGVSVAMTGLSAGSVTATEGEFQVEVPPGAGFSSDTIVTLTLPTAVPQFDTIYLSTL